MDSTKKLLDLSLRLFIRIKLNTVYFKTVQKCKFSHIMTWSNEENIILTPKITI